MLKEDKKDCSYKIQIKPNKQETIIEFSVDNLTQIEEDIDAILYDMDVLYKISNTSLNRMKFSSLFTVKPDKIIFLSDFEAWTIWEKAALILFVKYPYSSTKTFLYNHDGIDSKHLTTYIDRHKDKFIEHENGELSLTYKGYRIIKEKLEKELEKGLEEINELE